MPKIELSKAEIEKAKKLIQERRRMINAVEPAREKPVEPAREKPMVDNILPKKRAVEPVREVVFSVPPPNSTPVQVRSEPIEPMPTKMPPKDKHTQAIEEMMKRGII